MDMFYNMTFKRKFAVNFFKDLKFEIAKMSFSKDWINLKTGDPYPKLFEKGKVTEKIKNGCFSVCGEENSEVKRLIGQHFPYGTYEVKINDLSNGAAVGFSIGFFNSKDFLDIYIKRESKKVSAFFDLKDGETRVNLKKYEFRKGMAFMVTCHHGKCFDLYLKYENHIEKIDEIIIDEYEKTINEKIFKNMTAAVCAKFPVGGKAVIEGVELYADCGISQADIKPVRYEDGSAVMQNGRMFLTVTSRFESQMYQSVISFNPSGCGFKMEGAVLFDTGDGDWCGDVASSLIYDRCDKSWKIWMCSFSHGHILGYAQFKNDVRFGINVLDVTLMETNKNSADTDFFAKPGDEDPDFYYDENENKWYMSICRIDKNTNAYSYFLFKSDNAFKGYKFVSKTNADAVTGGMFTKIDNKRYFVCGANFDKRAQYNIYELPDFANCRHIKCDFDDGGFRGWGSVISYMSGSREKYIWLTFDRHNASVYNWSYGTIYFYEADITKKIGD